MYEQKPNTGSLWTRPTHKVSKAGKPYEVYKGRACVACPNCQKLYNYWLTAFLNESNSGPVYDFYLNERQQAEKEFLDSQA